MTSNEYELSLIRRMDAAYAAWQRTDDPYLKATYERLKRRVDARLGMDTPKVVPFRRREQEQAS